ncbi:SGNH/GDSL hydrolase family protein [Nocardioides marmoribigeumensis]|uniref:Lysophospholipase L1-like esterase n=1 Tax=Nocardioides marmoribigeumensis TaxID=433649 RepID=A0ABU2BTZ4_9ACTN|nr:SGNH/GDSL hydrolase family protein [Nocardioides marmoribigeumensis]MDR7361499.1 lysophospholipase L1-like esterase [Nocardioides marmoribigeumensis]
MPPRLPLPVLLPLLPVLAAQGRDVRRRTPVLPPSQVTSGRLGEEGEPIRLVVLGDSVAAGTGVADPRRTISAELARRLHLRHRRPVEWRVFATSGLDAVGVRELVVEHADDLASASVVLVSVGVNDAKDLHSVRRWSRDLDALLSQVERNAPHARVLLLGIPPMEAFPALTGTLGWALGGRSRMLDRAGARVAADHERVRRIALRPDDLPGSIEGFADDGFHPGPGAHEHLALKALAALG